jgi:hypothetical protein
MNARMLAATSVAENAATVPLAAVATGPEATGLRATVVRAPAATEGIGPVEIVVRGAIEVRAAAASGMARRRSTLRS